VSARVTPHLLEQFVPAPPASVYALMADPNNLPRLHPLIRRIAITRQDATRVEFELDETVPLGPFSIHNRYTGTFELQPNAPRSLRTFGVSSPRVTVRAQFTFDPERDGTLLRESVVITAPFGLQGFVTTTALDAHRQQLQAIAKHFGG
jgi:hypothetical protein